MLERETDTDPDELDQGAHRVRKAFGLIFSSPSRTKTTEHTWIRYKGFVTSKISVPLCSRYRTLPSVAISSTNLAVDAPQPPVVPTPCNTTCRGTEVTQSMAPVDGFQFEAAVVAY
jgi:hypothetical protein